MNREDLLYHPEVQLAIQQAAVRVGRRYRRYVTIDDLVQSAHIWVMQHPRKVAAELPDEEDSERSQRQAFGRLVRLLERALEGVGRLEKAAAEGYEVEDEVFYEYGLIEEMLSTVFDDNAALNPPQQDGAKVKSTSDPAEGNNWPTTCSDIKRAWQLADLSTDDRTMLSLRYGSGLTLDQVANAMEVTKETALKRLRSGVHTLARTLHGIRPLYISAEDDDIEPQEDDASV